MLSNAGLGKEFWAEAVNTAYHLVNHSPHSTLDGKTPKHVWSNNLQEYLHLKIFGCSTYAHVNIGKLDARLVKCIFIGYATGIKRLQIV